MPRLLFVLLLLISSCAFAAEGDPRPDAPPGGPPPAAPPGNEQPQAPAQPAEKPPKADKRPPVPGKPEPVEIANPSFDEELKGWDHADDPALAGVFTLDHDLKRMGKASLHVKPQMPDQWPWISQKVPDIIPGAYYGLRVWHQGGTQPGADTCAAARLEFLDEAGKTVGARVARQRVAMQQWVQLGLQTQAPLTAKSAVIYLRVMGSTEVWLDDVELIRSLEVSKLTLTPRRFAVRPGTEQTQHLELVATEDLPDEAKPTATLVGPDGKTVKGVTGALERKDKRTWAGDFTIPKLKSGRFIWQVKLDKDGAMATVWVALAERRPKLLNDRGFLVLPDGQTYFPIGIYHAPVGDYKALADQGFNAVQGLATNDARILKDAVQRAQDAKLWVQIPLHLGGQVAANVQPSAEKLPYFRKIIGVLDWKLADEPDQNPEAIDEVPEAYARLKARDPQRPLLVTIEDPATYGFWAPFCDSLQVVGMPLPDRPVTEVGERVKAARQALEPWQHLSVVLQAGYRTGAVVQPTFEQARMMVYLAIINGARSIWWYAYRDPGWKLAETELWKQFRKLNDETAALGQAAVSGPEATLQTDNPKVQTGAWQTAAKVFVALANPGGEPQTVTLKGDSAFGKAEVTQGKATAEVKDGAVSVTLAAGDAALVVLGIAGKEEPPAPAKVETPQQTPAKAPETPAKPAEAPAKPGQ